MLTVVKGRKKEEKWSGRDFYRDRVRTNNGSELPRQQTALVYD
jgi:hypothetical protein